MARFESSMTIGVTKAIRSRSRANGPGLRPSMRVLFRPRFLAVRCRPRGRRPGRRWAGLG
eukprot:9212185-Alexandrium_andersonii.AAC.1